MEIRTARLLLRELRESDLDAFYAIESHPEVMRYERDSMTEVAAREKLRGILTDAQAEPRKKFYFAVTLPADDQLRGIVAVRINWENVREWEVGWTIDPALWGKGYATEAGNEMVKMGFTQLNAHRVVAFCHAGNTASFRVMEKLGMTCEGRTRETRWLHNQWNDEFIYSILDREFKER
jgi:RimJ/RimL family protein N-acetyltransferase